MGKPITISWQPPIRAAGFVAGDDTLMLIVARRAPDGTERPLLMFAIGLDRLYGFDASFHGSNDGVMELARHEGRPMSWADVEEIAAYIQTWGPEYAPIADSLRERWAVRTEIAPMDAPANATVEVVGVDLKMYETAQAQIAQLESALARERAQRAAHECSVRVTTSPVSDNAQTRSGSIVCQQVVGGNLVITKSHTPSERITIERGDLDDLKAALDAILQLRVEYPNGHRIMEARSNNPMILVIRDHAERLHIEHQRGGGSFTIDRADVPDLIFGLRDLGLVS